MKKGLKKRQASYEEYSVADGDYTIKTTDNAKKKSKKKKEATKKARDPKKIINIVFIILVVIMIMIATDVICVSRYNIGPFFAIRTKQYEDGGTKEYYGLGYKVIKYNQVQGRRDTKIGFWTMPYSVEPTTISTLDLAIEFRNHPEETSKKFTGEFLRIVGDISKIDKDSNQIELQYIDPDEAYTLKIICPMAEEDSNIDELEEGKEANVIGSVKSFSLATKNAPNTITMSDCFAEQEEE